MTGDFTTITMEAIDNGKIILNSEFYKKKLFKREDEIKIQTKTNTVI